MKPPLPAATQPVRVAAGGGQPMSAASQPATASRPGPGSQSREAVTPPHGTAAQPRAASTQPAEARRRRPSSAEEDPLTSAAFSLRPSGPVDGRSSSRGRNGTANGYDTGSRGEASPYPYAAPTYGDSSSVTQTMSTPPYGQDYGYGSSATPAEPRPRNGTRRHARPESAGEGTRPVRQAYPRGSHQATGSYQGSGGAHAGNGREAASYPVGGYQGSGYPGGGRRGNGHRAPYDPRDDYRQLTQPH
jgi:hypothetical protein